MARHARRALLFLVTFLVGCDHATKLVAERTLEGNAPVHVVKGVFDLHYTRNYDVAFSLLRGPSGAMSSDLKAIVLAVVASLATLAVGAVWFRRRAAMSKLEHWGFAAILAGALGNVADRLTRGYVVDFLELPHWPVFNVADVCVVLGVLALALAYRTSRGAPLPSAPG